MAEAVLDAIGEPDYDTRFASAQWDRVGGSIQSLIFTIKALEILKTKYPSIVKFITCAEPLVDYGCALGDGAAVLSATFQGVPVIGVDISRAAVNRARARWPTLRFQEGDIRHPTIDAHTIWTSHTLEHQADPLATVEALRKKCRLLVAIFPPIPPDDQSEAHKGAVPVNEWLPQAEFPLVHEEFQTRRKDVTRENSSGYYMLEENNVMCVWRGLR